MTGGRLLGALLLISSPALAQIQFRQTAGANANAATITVNLPVPAETGHLLILSVESSPYDLPVMVTDNGGLSWQRDDAVRGKGTLATSRVSLFHAVASASVNAIQITVPAATFLEAVAFEYLGVDPLDPVDSVSVNFSDSSTAEGGPYATHWPGELVFNALIVSGAQPASDPAFNTRSTWNFDLFQDQLVPVPKSVKTVPVASGPWVSVMAGYRPAGAPRAPSSAKVLQRAVGSVFDAGTLIVSFLEPIAAGSAVVAAIEWAPPTASPYAVDDQGRPLSLESNQLGLSPRSGTGVFYLPRGDGGTPGIHYALPGGTYLQIVQLEYQGLADGPPLAESHSAGTGTTQVTNALGAGQPGLLLSWLVSDGEFVAADLASTTRSNSFEDLLEDRVVRAPGSYSLLAVEDAGSWTAHQLLFALVDAGLDVDAGGTPDGGVSPDGGAPPDAGTPVDGGTRLPGPPKVFTVGCDCSAGPGSAGALLAAALLVFLRRPRDRR